MKTNDNQRPYQIKKKVSFNVSSLHQRAANFNTLFFRNLLHQKFSQLLKMLISIFTHSFQLIYK